MSDLIPQENDAVEPTENNPQRRAIKSFVLRQGRLTEGQQRALDSLWPKYGLTLDSGALDYSAVFGNENPVWLEIGFGMGKSLAAMAEQLPERNFIGIEVHRPGVGALLNEVANTHLTNIRIFNHDAIEVLNQCIPDHSLDGLMLFFPDPWPKKKHHKRRIVQTEFAQLVWRKLKTGGVFHMATDWQNYAEHMMEVMSAQANYKNCAGEGNYTPRPESRPMTKFEVRGERLGHGVWDLMFAAAPNPVL